MEYQNIQNKLTPLFEELLDYLLMNIFPANIPQYTYTIATHRLGQLQATVCNGYIELLSFLWAYTGVITCSVPPSDCSVV